MEPSLTMPKASYSSETDKMQDNTNVAHDIMLIYLKVFNKSLAI